MTAVLPIFEPLLNKHENYTMVTEVQQKVNYLCSIVKQVMKTSFPLRLIRAENGMKRAGRVTLTGRIIKMYYFKFDG